MNGSPIDGGSPDVGSPDVGSPDDGSPDDGSPDVGSAGPDRRRDDSNPDDSNPDDSSPDDSSSEDSSADDSSPDEAGRLAQPVRHPLPLLESLVSDHLDPGYQAAADRRAARATGPVPPGRPSRPGWSQRSGQSGRSRALAYLSAGLVVVGLVLGIAAASTKDQAAGNDAARSGLLQDIDNAQTKQSSLAAQQTSLASAIRRAQAALGAGGPLARIAQLEQQGGQSAVTGPGLTVVIDGSTTSSGAGQILDRDIQLLVNGLWSSGAEAVSIGGVRLSTTSAIRQAGSAILVDNRPVFWPISIQAIGDPSTLHVRFVDTVGFGRFQTFVSLYGIRFDVSAQSALTLPAGGAPDLQYASPVPTSSH